MNILAIDTSTQAELVAVSAAGKTFDMTRIVDVSHSALLFKSVDSAYAASGISIKDTELIAVGTGPGSFTGIRIAVTAARMLAQLLNVPLVGIRSPLIYAASAPAAPGDYILIAFDAKKSRVFGSLYRKASGLLPEEIVQPGDYHINDLINDIDDNFTTFIAGDGGEKYHNSIVNGMIRNHSLLKNFLPSGTAACEIALELFEKAPRLYYDINSVVPCYSRKSDAEALRRG